MVTNSDGDTGRFKMLCDWEHDDPEQAPTYRHQPLVNLCGILWVTQETARELATEEV